MKRPCAERKEFQDHGEREYFQKIEMAARKIQVRYLGNLENGNDSKAVNQTREFIT